MSSDWNAACRDSAWVAGSRSSLFSGPEAFRQQPWFCRLKFPGLMKKTKKTRSGGTGCGTQWVSGSRRGNQLNAAAGRRTAVATGQVLNAPGGALVSAVRRLEDCYRGLQEKIVQLEGKKRSQKQLITSLKNRPFYHLLHRKEGQLPDEKCDALPLRAEKLSLPQSGIQTWRWRNGQPGSSGWLPCVLSRRKESWSWKGSLPRKVRSSLTCRHIPFLTCGINTAARSCSGDGGWVFCALSTGCWCHECSRSIATH